MAASAFPNAEYIHVAKRERVGRLKSAPRVEVRQGRGPELLLKLLRDPGLALKAEK